jgi:dynein heavy chain
MIIKRNRPTPTNTTRKAIEGDGSPVADAQSEGKKSMPRLVKTEIPAQGLWTDRDGLCYWRRLKIQKYLLQSERYEGYWENTKEKCRLHRIQILFDDEDPREFAKRFKVAYGSRVMADSLIKYNFYIENMPTHQIPEIDNDEVNRILSMTQNTKQLRGKSSSDTTTLLSEVNFEFAKTMNKIIFDKHLGTNGPNLISGPLTLPAEKPKELPPYYGMITIPPHNFPEQFSNFCFNSILNKDQSIRAMQEIRKECNDVLVKDIYNPNITKSMKVQEFKQIQKSSTSQISYYLKETWVNKIKDIIKTNFAEDVASSSQFGKPWYSLNETSKEAYEMGKLKKFLTQARFVMQDTLLYMTEASVKRFVASICYFVPISAEVVSSNEVKNKYYTDEEIAQMGAEK